MKFIAILIVLLHTLPAQARWMTIKEAGSVIEKYDTTFDVKKDGSSLETIDYLARVQGEDAKTSISLFNIEYNPLVEDVKILEAYTLNGREKIMVEASAIEDRDKGESKEYDAIKIRSVVFPQVQVGSKVAIRYTIFSKRPTVEGEWSNDVYLEPGYFLEKFKVRVHSELPIYYNVVDSRGWLRVSQKDAHSLEIENKKLILGPVVGEKDVFFHPEGFAHVFISSEKSWNKYFSSVDRDFAKILSADLPSSLKKAVAKAERAKTVQDRIFVLMNFISREFRYFGDWRRNNGGIVPRTLKEIEKTRYGDCKDLASILTAMLSQLKIDAHVAIVRRGENPWGHEPDYTLPVVARFNHAIVQAKVGGETYWLDATNPVASLKPMADIAGRPAWILSGETSHMDRLPEAQAKDYLYDHVRELRFPSRETVKFHMVSDLKKMGAAQTANQLFVQPRADVLTAIFEYFSDGQEVRSYRYTEEPEASRVLKDIRIGIDYETERVTFEAGKDSFYAFPDKILAGAFYETADRESDLRLSNEPFYMTNTRRFKDTKLAQTMPGPCRVHSRWLDVDRTMAVEGKDLVMNEIFELRQPYITHDEYRTKEFKKFQDDTKKCLYRSGILIDLPAH